MSSSIVLTLTDFVHCPTFEPWSRCEKVLMEYLHSALTFINTVWGKGKQSPGAPSHLLLIVLSTGNWLKKNFILAQKKPKKLQPVQKLRMWMLIPKLLLYWIHHLGKKGKSKKQKQKEMCLRVSGCVCVKNFLKTRQLPPSLLIALIF